MTEPNNIRVALFEAGIEGKMLCIINQWDKSFLAILVITYENGELASRLQGLGAIPNELAIPCEERV